MFSWNANILIQDLQLESNRKCNISFNSDFQLASLRPQKGREEMSILSKILVTLLCSCKSAEATAELRKIIRHFKEAASEASDEVEDEIKPIMRSSKTSSRGSKRRYDTFYKQID